MIKRARLAVGGLGILVLLTVSLSSCFLFGGPGITGYVYDAFGNPLQNVSVTANDNIGDSYSTTTDSSGKWFVPDPKQGTYTFSASGSGYYFTTPIYGATYTNGASVTADMIVGVSLSNVWSSYENYLFILTWNGAPSSLYLHMTIPKTNYAPAAGPSGGNPESPVWVPDNSTDLGYWMSGFAPDTSPQYVTNARYDVSYFSPNPFGDYSVQSISTVQGTGPLTIQLTGAVQTHLTSGWTVTPDGNNLFPFPVSGTTTDFAGVAQLYIDGNGTNLSNLGHAVLYIIDVAPNGTSATPDGALLISQDQNGEQGVVLSTSTASLARINIFGSGFQIVTDFKPVASGAIRGVVSAQGSGPYVIDLPRK